MPEKNFAGLVTAMGDNSPEIKRFLTATRQKGESYIIYLAVWKREIADPLLHNPLSCGSRAVYRPLALLATSAGTKHLK